jgi:hypothetical protein
MTDFILTAALVFACGLSLDSVVEILTPTRS